MTKPPKSKTGGTRNPERRNGKAWKKNKDQTTAIRELREAVNRGLIVAHEAAYGPLKPTKTTRRRFLHNARSSN